MKKITVILGTRPEGIKLAPVIRELRSRPAFEVRVCVTGQHREMLEQVLGLFEIVPDADLALMRPDQTLADLTARSISAVDEYLRAHPTEMILVQGDTTTVFAAALAAYYRGIAVGHVEAGLRTWNKRSPFPEEINRQLASRIADVHFAPTEWARQNLLREGTPASTIHVTGNTVIDALQHTAARVRQRQVAIPGLVPDFFNNSKRRLILITGHRRENFGKGFEDICQAIGVLAEKFNEVDFVYPVHLNPNVRGPVTRLLGGKTNVHLIAPLEYSAFVQLMDRSHIILTDSGGVQEEAPSLGKPVLVMRDTTERPEAVEAGTVRLVGTNPDKIIGAVNELMMNRAAYEAMARAHNPYGDGRAAVRIADVLGCL